MKKLLTLIAAAGLALTMQAQHITNTLGTNGKFEVKEDGGTTSLFSVEEEGTTAKPYVIVGNNNNSDQLYLKRELNIVSESGTAGINLYSYKDTGFGSFNKMGYFHARGNISAPANVHTSDELGRLTWYGYNGNWAESEAASISVGIESVATNSTAGKIRFLTTPVGSHTPTDRMTIKSDGTVNIAGLSGGTVAVAGDKAVYVTSGGDLVVGAALTTPQINNQIQQLKEENAALKAEMAELQKIVEGLMEK